MSWELLLLETISKESFQSPEVLTLNGDAIAGHYYHPCTCQQWPRSQVLPNHTRGVRPRVWLALHPCVASRIQHVPNQSGNLPPNQPPCPQTSIPYLGEGLDSSQVQATMSHGSQVLGSSTSLWLHYSTSIHGHQLLFFGLKLYFFLNWLSCHPKLCAVVKDSKMQEWLYHTRLKPANIFPLMLK